MSLTGLCELPKLGALQVGGLAALLLRTAKDVSPIRPTYMEWGGAALVSMRKQGSPERKLILALGRACRSAGDP